MKANPAQRDIRNKAGPSLGTTGRVRYSRLSSWLCTAIACTAIVTALPGCGTDGIVAGVRECPDGTAYEPGRCETFDDALDRARAPECFGLWASVGTCGRWLYLAETSGYVATISYYHPDTRIIAARQWCSDVVEDGGPCRFTLGQVDCQPQVTDTIPCEP